MSKHGVNLSEAERVAFLANLKNYDLCMGDKYYVNYVIDTGKTSKSHHLSDFFRSVSTNNSVILTQENEVNA